MRCVVAPFSTVDLLDLAQLVADAWEVGADRDWTVPAGTVKSRLFYGRQEFKEIFWSLTNRRPVH